MQIALAFPNILICLARGFSKFFSFWLLKHSLITTTFFIVSFRSTA